MEKGKDVVVNYSEYGNTPVAQAIAFELVEDVLLKLKYDEDDKSVSISMMDTISENTQLEGKLDYEKLNVLLRALTQLKNQIKANL